MATDNATAVRKELRKQARKLNIDGWEGMTEKQLAKAIKSLQTAVVSAVEAPSKEKAKTNGKGKTTKVPRGQTKADKGEPVTPTEKAKASKSKDKPAKETKKPKSKPKKAPKTSQGARDEQVAENGNPFRPGSNAFKHTELLIKGGNRAKIIEKLIKVTEFRPWGGKKPPKKAADLTKMMDKRLLMTMHQLQHLHGFTVVITGRGPEKSTVQAFPPGAKIPAEVLNKATIVNGVRPGATKTAKPTPAKRTTSKATAKKASKPATAKKTSKTTAKKTAAKAKKK